MKHTVTTNIESLIKRKVSKTITHITTALILITATAIAQPPIWEEGYVVTLNGDTSYGEIQFIEYANGSSHINFWDYSGAPGNESQYAACNISSFKIGNEKFDSKEVGSNFLFLKRIIEGRATLYHYDYDNRSTGWPKPDPDALIGSGITAGATNSISYRKTLCLLELSNKNIEIVERRGFNRAMQNLLEDCPETLTSLKKGSYKYQQIKSLITFYNSCGQDHSKPIASSK